MEHSKEGKRTSGNCVLSTTRRQRTPDEEDRVHERQKKERLTTSRLSVSPSVANKRKRQGLPQLEGAFADNARPPMDSSEAAASEDDDESLHAFKKEKPRQERAFAMNFSPVPRKPRSSRTSSARFTSIMKRKGSLLAEQKSPQLPLNGTSSPSFPLTFVRRSKTEVAKSRAPKVLKVSDSLVISDKEAEVAEALFALSRSVPRLLGLSKPQNETHLVTEAEFARVSNPGYFTPSSQSPNPFEEATKRMIPQAVGKQDEASVSAPLGTVALSTVLSSSSPSGVIHSSVGESEPEQLDRAYSAGGEAHSLPSGMPGSKFKEGASQVLLCQPNALKKGNLESSFENTNKNDGGAQAEKQLKGSTAKCQSQAFLVKSGSPVTHGHSIEPESLNRSYKPKPRSEVKMNQGKTPTSCKSEVLSDSDKGLSNHLLVKEGLSAHNGGSSKLQEKRGKRDSSQECQGYSRKLQRKEGGDGRTIRTSEEMGSSHLWQSKNNDAGSGNASSCISSTGVSSSPNFWMGGFPQLGYYGCGATGWPTGVAIPALSADVKATHPTSELAHAAVLPPAPVQKMKSCATHVYLAHFIRREQQVSQQLLWSTAICRAAPLNPNVPPGIKMENGVAASGARVLADHSPATASGNAMMAHAQYLQAMVHHSSFASWPYPFNGPASQASPLFGAPFFQHGMSSSTAPHLQPRGQEHGLPVQKQQVGNGTPPRASVQKHCRPGAMESREMLATSTGAMPSFDQAVAFMENSGAKPISKPQDDHHHHHHQVHWQGPPRQQQQLISQNIASMSGPQLKKLNQEIFEGYSVVASGRRPVGPGPLGLPSVASLLAEECHGVLPVSCEKDKNQQSHKLVNKATSARNPSAVTVQDNHEYKGASMKHFSKENLDSSPFLLRGTASANSPPPSQATTNLRMNIPGAHSSKPALTTGVGGEGVPFHVAKDMVSDYAERPLPGKHGNIPELVQLPRYILPSSHGLQSDHASITTGQKTTLQGPAQQVRSNALLMNPVQHAGGVPSGASSTPLTPISMLSSPPSLSTALNTSPEYSLYGKGMASVNKSEPSNKKMSVNGAASVSESLGLKAQQSTLYPSVYAQHVSVETTSTDAQLQVQYKHALPPEVHAQQPQQDAVSESLPEQQAVPSDLPDCGEQQLSQLATSALSMDGNNSLPSSPVHSIVGAVSGSDGTDQAIVLGSKADEHNAEYGTKDAIISGEMPEISARSSSAVFRQVSSSLQPAPVILAEQCKPTLDGLNLPSSSPSEATMASS